MKPVVIGLAMLVMIQFSVESTETPTPSIQPAASPTEKQLHSADPKMLDALRDAQIKALISGDVSDLMPFSGQTVPIRLTVQWTTIAAKQFAAAKAHVSPDSAEMTSEFISEGASSFAAKGSPIEKRSEAECNLKAFIAAEIAVGALENPQHPKIGETTFSKVSRALCPLWPFC